jgi:threonine synthase
MLDLEEQYFDFSMNDIIKNEWSLFRYSNIFPFFSDTNIWKGISMGEGFTPIVRLDNSCDNILVKVDYLMPTLSFKDRGAVILIAVAKELGIKKVIQDSSGNAGNSIAAYASRAGIACDIYVPEGTSSQKIKQISAHGAKVYVISKTREDAAQKALEAVERGEGFYASHVYNPLFYQGTKTYAYEVYEQLEGQIPETMVIPVGNGTLLLGVYYGFKELFNRGLIEKIPKLIAVQAEGCAPIYQAYKNNQNVVKDVVTTPTKAEGIAIAQPKRGSQILQAIKDTNGEIIVAPEDKILNAKRYLANKGFYVEDTTAATLAAFFEYKKTHIINGKVLIPLCGAGLKGKQ